MSYKLYNRDGSGGFAVEAALILAEAPFELVTLDSLPSTPLPDSFREINPWRQVPVLILPDGTTLTETAAILIHIAACHPEKSLAPAPGTPEHGTFLRWMVFLSVNMYETILRRTYADRYTTDAEGLDGVREAATRRLGDGFGVLEDALAPGRFLLGDDMTAADVYLAMLNAWHGEGKGFPRCDGVSHRVARHEIIAPIWQRNFDHRLSTKWGRGKAGGN